MTLETYGSRNAYLSLLCSSLMFLLVGWIYMQCVWCRYLCGHSYLFTIC